MKADKRLAPWTRERSEAHWSGRSPCVTQKAALEEEIRMPIITKDGQLSRLGSLRGSLPLFIKWMRSSSLVAP